MAQAQEKMFFAETLSVEDDVVNKCAFFKTTQVICTWYHRTRAHVKYSNSIIAVLLAISVNGPLSNNHSAVGTKRFVLCVVSMMQFNPASKILTGYSTNEG